MTELHPGPVQIGRTGFLRVKPEVKGAEVTDIDFKTATGGAAGGREHQPMPHQPHCLSCRGSCSCPAALGLTEGEAEQSPPQHCPLHPGQGSRGSPTQLISATVSCLVTQHCLCRGACLHSIPTNPTFSRGDIAHHRPCTWGPVWCCPHTPQPLRPGLAAHSVPCRQYSKGFSFCI